MINIKSAFDRVALISLSLGFVSAVLVLVNGEVLKGILPLFLMVTAFYLYFFKKDSR